MKKIVTWLVVGMMLGAIALGAAGNQARGFLGGVRAPLETGEYLRPYIGWDSFSTPFIVTIGKETLDSWEGVYNFGVMYEWYFGPSTGLRAGLDVDLDFSTAGVQLDALGVRMGPIWEIADWIGFGVALLYNGDFAIEFSVEFWPSGLEQPQ